MGLMQVAADTKLVEYYCLCEGLRSIKKELQKGDKLVLDLMRDGMCSRAIIMPSSRILWQSRQGLLTLESAVRWEP